MTTLSTIEGVDFSLDKVQIPDSLTQEQWAEVHRQILISKKASARWLNQSRAYASGKWGDDYVGEAERQMELALGLPAPDDKPSLNPADKSKAIITIEGISQSFKMWDRKMSDEIESWSVDQLAKAYDLLKPIEDRARSIKSKLEACAHPL